MNAQSDRFSCKRSTECSGRVLAQWRSMQSDRFSITRLTVALLIQGAPLPPYFRLASVSQPVPFSSAAGTEMNGSTGGNYITPLVLWIGLGPSELLLDPSIIKDKFPYSSMPEASGIFSNALTLKGLPQPNLPNQ